MFSDVSIHFSSGSRTKTPSTLPPPIPATSRAIRGPLVESPSFSQPDSYKRELNSQEKAQQQQFLNQQYAQHRLKRKMKKAPKPKL